MLVQLHLGSSELFWLLFVRRLLIPLAVGWEQWDDTRRSSEVQLKSREARQCVNSVHDLESYSRQHADPSFLITLDMILE
jgi:hypothetical protein